MKRRTFLKSAGSAATAASIFSASGANPPLSLSPIKHIIYVMMENRSFDHMLGWLPNADGKQEGLTYAAPDGSTQTTHGLAPDWTGCGYADPDHSYSGAREQYNGGAMDGWLQDPENDRYSIGYYTERDVPVLGGLARNFTTCDRYFSSILGPTLPNRIFAMAGQTDRIDNSLFVCKLPTIWDNLQAAGVSCKYYYSNIPVLALWGLKYQNISFQLEDFLSDCAQGRLPSVSWVDPSLTLLLNFANDDHPHSDIRNAQSFLSQIYQAVASSPDWESTVLVINRDEWGGFFDHVAPPRAQAPNAVDPDLENGKALLGFRVPAFVVSPWTVGQRLNPTVSSTVFDHTSVLKLIESVFGIPPLGARETSPDVGNLLSLIDTKSPRQAAPRIPISDAVFPQTVCGISSGVTGDVRSHTPFQGMADAGLFSGWKASY